MKTKLTESDIIRILNKYEAKGMRSHPDIIWSRANSHFVTDINGKEYIDFSSGVMITNAGHNCPDINESIIDWLKTGMYTSYMFPNLAKAKLLAALGEVIPNSYKVALYSSGAESIESAIKIARIWGMKYKKKSKNLIVSYINSYHGKTLGAQCVSGIDALKTWIPKDIGKSFVCRVPFPDKMYSNSDQFDSFKTSLNSQQISAADVAAVIIECYQGSVGSFIPEKYMEDLGAWCKENKILLIIDEIQSSFGRTGKFWAYEHYNIIPDVIVTGKGLSSSLPLSAVIAKPEIIDLSPIGTLNTTHSGNPICCVAAEANIRFIQKHKLVEQAAKLEPILLNQLNLIKKDFPNKIKEIFGKGLMAAIHLGNSEGVANPKLASNLVSRCIENGLILYNAGGVEASTIKVTPPLTIDEESLIKGFELIRQSLNEIE